MTKQARGYTRLESLNPSYNGNIRINTNISPERGKEILNSLYEACDSTNFEYLEKTIEKIIMDIYNA